MSAAQEQAIGKELQAALNALKAAQAGAKAVGYGDQFRGSLDDAIAQVNHTLGMLA